ncbi:MAG: stage V sporulation protein D [Clostridia bacterium]|nr:stage V sporulation protein D [Clostridia bacterium]
MYIQVFWGEELQIKALDQWTRNVPILAKRGDITDRNGVVLATTKKTFTVFVRPRAVTNANEVSSVLAEIFGLDKSKLLEKITTTKVSEIKIVKHAEKDLIDELSKYSLNGVYFAEDVTRYYPYDELLAQVLGYTSADGNGISGLELYYNRYLSGENGEILYEADLTGKDLQGKTPSYVPAINGLNVKLTIDYDVQQILESVTDKAMSEYSPKQASAIVIDPQNGEVLGMAMKPSLNLNEVPLGDLDTLNKVGRITLISDSYEPGSTFKVLTASANVNEYLLGNSKAFSENHVFNSSRYRYIDGSKIKCWSNHNNGKHANETLSLALNNSCNPIFVDIALSLGKESFYSYLSGFGYGKVTGIDLSGEAQGMIIPKQAVKNADLARISFGQAIACTPLQLVMATATAINGGKLYSPYLVKEVYDNQGTLSSKTEPKVTSTPISEKTSKIITSYLEQVVENGSGKQAYIEGYRVGGKTGTAQKYQNGVISQGKYVMSFIGFFPANMPKYLCLVIVDEPVGGTYGSTVAAPYAKEIFEKIIASKGL